MFDLIALPPALPPLIELTIALCALWVGWRTLRSGAIPAPLASLVRVNAALSQALRTRGAPGEATGDLTVDRLRIYGWAFVYAGAFGLILAAGQLMRLAGGLG